MRIKKIALVLSVLCIIINITGCVNYQDKTPKESIVERVKESQDTFWTSSMASEGNDFYIISMRDDGATIAIPSLYAVGKNFRFTRRRIGEIGDISVINDQMEYFIINIFSIKTGEKIKTINVDDLLNESYPDYQLATASIVPVCYQEKPCLRTIIEKRPETVEDAQQDTMKQVFIDVENEIVYLEDYSREQGKTRQVFPMDWKLNIFTNHMSYDLLELNGVGDALVENIGYMEGACVISLPVSSLPERNKELYSMFPKLKEQIKEVLKLGEENADDVPGIKIVLTDNPTPEDILLLLINDDERIIFEGMKISKYDSIDGQEHDIHSFEEYYELRKPYEGTLNTWDVSPIFIEGEQHNN